MLTADVTPEAIQQCAQAGARAFLPKPVVAARLLDTLAEVATSGQASTPQPTARVELPVGDDDFDPGVLEELGSLGMGDDPRASYDVVAVPLSGKPFLFEAVRPKA